MEKGRATEGEHATAGRAAIKFRITAVDKLRVALCSKTRSD
jgi:hypothetical protein